MPKYSVFVSTTIQNELEIDADCEEDAEDKAMKYMHAICSGQGAISIDTEIYTITELD